jgi:hypothetical protein
MKKTLMLLVLLLLLSSCVSYPVLPQEDYGEEPVPEYFAAAPLPWGEGDDRFVEVKIGELKRALFVYEEKESLLVAINERGERMEKMMAERDALLRAAKQTNLVGKTNTWIGTGVGAGFGFLFGFTLFALVSIGGSE